MAERLLKPLKKRHKNTVGIVLTPRKSEIELAQDDGRRNSLRYSNSVRYVLRGAKV
jgi:hypothetical protein